MLTIDERQPRHLCDFVRSKMSTSDFAGVFNVESDCACVVKTLVLGALSFKPQVTGRSKQCTRASSMLRTFVQILRKFSLAPHPSIHCSFATGIPTVKGKIENVGFGVRDAFCNVVYVRFGVKLSMNSWGQWASLVYDWMLPEGPYWEVQPPNVCDEGRSNCESPGSGSRAEVVKMHIWRLVDVWCSTTLIALNRYVIGYWRKTKSFCTRGNECESEVDSEPTLVSSQGPFAR